MDILPWKTPFWKIKPKRSDFPRGKITPSGLTVGDCKLREKCQGHPKRESGHAGKARIAFSRAQDGHAAPYARGYQGGQTRQRPQAEQAHQHLPVCAAHPTSDGCQREDDDDQRGQPPHSLVRVQVEERPAQAKQEQGDGEPVVHLPLAKILEACDGNENGQRTGDEQVT